jgi:hypothetical protein
VTKPDIIVCPDAVEPNRRAAQRFIQRANEARLASKAAIVKEILGAHPTIAKFPAQRIQPIIGALTWFMARDAAAQLPVG